MSTSTRIFFCPSCGARFSVALSLIVDASVVLLCGSCGNASRVADAPPVHVEVEEESEAARLLREASMPRVIVGHELPAAARSVANVLRAGGYAPVCVRSGELVLAACDPAMPSVPAAVVLDVAIPGVLAFEVIGQLRAQPSTRETPIILLASVFERTRYKRRPTNLYGADAYLELHHVPDRLAALIEEVRSKTAPSDDRLQMPVERARAAALRSRPDPADPETAQSFARRLLSDVALYHGDEIAAGARQGAPFASLAGALDAAREIFNGACPSVGIFDEELKRFSQDLLEREASRGRRADA